MRIKVSIYCRSHSCEYTSICRHMKPERSITLLLCVMFDAIIIKQNLNVGICVAESPTSTRACAAVCAVILADHRQHGVTSSSYRHHHQQPAASSQQQQRAAHTGRLINDDTVSIHDLLCRPHQHQSTRSQSQTFDLLVSGSRTVLVSLLSPDHLRGSAWLK